MTCTVEVEHGPKIEIGWVSGMNVQQAVEGAYNKAPTEFNYSLQYYGTLGYLVSMINETYDSYISTADPFYFWEFLVNGTPSSTGIDQTILNDSDVITFEFQAYNAQIDPGSTLHAKYALRLHTKDN